MVADAFRITHCHNYDSESFSCVYKYEGKSSSGRWSTADSLSLRDRNEFVQLLVNVRWVSSVDVVMVFTEPVSYVALDCLALQSQELSTEISLVFFSHISQLILALQSFDKRAKDHAEEHGLVRK